MQTIAIIGGGAAGMMAAASIIESGSDAHVILIEKNPSLGRKVIISGGGRCNVTTGLQDVRTLLTKYVRGNPFLTKALYGFPPADVYTWFEDHGVPLKKEEDNRVFPQSDDGHDIVGVFEKMFTPHPSRVPGFAASDVEVLLKTTIEKVEKKDSTFFLTTNAGKIIIADKLIITTGGQAYRHTGSTGDGYTFAESLGHTITPLAASLNAFVLKEKWPGEHSGVSFEWVKLTSILRSFDKLRTGGAQDDKCYAEGPMVFTHKGISGPAVFALSSQVAFEEYDKEHPLPITIDFVPSHSQEEMLQQLSEKIEINPKQFSRLALAEWIPRSIAEVLLKACAIPNNLTNAQMSKKDRMSAVEWLKHCTVHAVGRSAGSEFVTAGGVKTDEVNPATMESRVTPGLYFAGEVMNVDGITGGFNLQASWATGRLAGFSAIE